MFFEHTSFIQQLSLLFPRFFPVKLSTWLRVYLSQDSDVFSALPYRFYLYSPQMDDVFAKGDFVDMLKAVEAIEAAGLEAAEARNKLTRVMTVKIPLLPLQNRNEEKM